MTDTHHPITGHEAVCGCLDCFYDPHLNWPTCPCGVCKMTRNLIHADPEVRARIAAWSTNQGDTP